MVIEVDCDPSSHPAPTITPPATLSRRGPYRSSSPPTSGMVNAKNARKMMNGRRDSVAPTAKYFSSGFRKTDQA